MRSQRSGLYLYFLYQKDNILCTTFMTFVHLFLEILLK